MQARDVTVLHLARESQLQRLASQMAAKIEGGIIHAIDKNMVETVQKRTRLISVRPSKAARYVQEQEHIQMAWHSRLAFCKDISYFHVAYEDLILPTRKLQLLWAFQSFLGNTAQPSAIPTGPLLQLHSSRCRDRFENYAQIMETIEGTRTHNACRMLDKL
eukprot:TRINITY_DN9180_c0_g1_i1.p1 TRINITY_DN9180_c0_g1~~TRINITY_DN9180_c0_g1_i1.p1  ORF type:complete len:186 (+),score=12.84 TRINITY_DN9180_c0_g1_i1:76-558(+)